MAPATIDNLPLETLQAVAGYLHATHRPSLYAFSRANKNLHRVSLRFIFQDVHLAVRSHKSLQRDVDALVKALSGAGSASYVRGLGIKGFLVIDDPTSDGETKEMHMTPVASSELAWFQWHGIEEVLGDEEPFLRPVLSRDEPTKATPDEDAAWAPVVRLIEILPHLTKLVYNCRNQFPPSLLDALHQHQPQCRLYHLTFRLGSLVSEAIDPHELAIATSPCLHSVKARILYNWDDDFNEEAIRDIVAGFAPNLREVYILRLLPERLSRWRPNMGMGRGPWRGLPGFAPGLGIGSLTSLTIAGSLVMDPGASLADFVQNWTKATEFSSLRHLALGGGFECEHGISSNALGWIAQNCSLPKLETLRIRLDRRYEQERMHMGRPHHTSSAMDFFAALPPLRELSVSGALEPEILDAILSRHGCMLKKLSLRPLESSFTRHIPMVCKKEHILQIQAQCPELQDLAIPVKRTKSDIREAEIYKSLSDMAQLQHLFLTLDCSDWRVTRDHTRTADPSFDEIDRKTYSGGDPWVPQPKPHILWGHLREGFMNCAVDETLARSIWETICCNKSGKPLQSLKLYTTGGCSFGSGILHGKYSDYIGVVKHLSRSWLIERGVRDDEDALTVEELGRKAREARDQNLTERFVSVYGDDPERNAVVQILHRIWPRKEGSRDWREDWASLPLHAL